MFSFLTCSFWVDVDSGVCGRLFIKVILSNTLEVSVVLTQSDRLNTQHTDTSLLVCQDHIARMISKDLAPAAAPEHIRDWMTGNFTDQRHNSAIHHLLMYRRHRDLRRICSTRSQSTTIILLYYWNTGIPVFFLLR